MKKFTPELASASMTLTMLSGWHFNIEWVFNLSQNLYWALVVVSVPVFCVYAAKCVIINNKDDATKALDELNSLGDFKVLYVVNIVIVMLVMSAAGLIALPVCYLISNIVILYIRHISINVLKDTVRGE